MVVGAVAAYANVNNFTQQQAVTATPPASQAFDLRNSAVGEAQTRQAVKVSDSSNKGEVTKDRKDIKGEQRYAGGVSRRSRPPANRGNEIDIEV